MTATISSRIFAALAAGALLAAAPIGFHATASGVSLLPTAALAKHGADDTKPDDHGRRHGGHGADDTRPDDHGGKHRGRGRDD